MTERNFYAYQIDFQKIKTVNGEQVFTDYWSDQDFKAMTTQITGKDIKDRKKVNNGWFMLLDDFQILTDRYKSKNTGKYVTHKYYVGRFMNAEFGYVGKLRHVDTMVQRDNNKNTREGEEKFVYFYVRASDGLLLLQGDQKVIRSKVEEYFEGFGKEYLDNHGIKSIAVRTLLRGDFLDEVKKLDEVNKIEIELAVEKTSSYENELLTTAQNQAQEFEANYATIVLQSKYKKKSLSGFEKWLGKIKPKGNKTPIKGVSNIKVIGKSDGEYKRVYLSKISEKYPVEIKVDDNKNIDKSDAYIKVRNIGRKREPIWRGEAGESEI